MSVFEIQIRQSRPGEYCSVECIHRKLNYSPNHLHGKFWLEKRDELDKLADDTTQSEEYGKRLGEALFKDEVRDEFAAAVREGSDKNPLRVLLYIEDEELKSLRWEKLCTPKENKSWFFLRLDPCVTFSIYVPSPIDSSLFPPISKFDLRALVLVASPKNTPGLDHFEVQKTVDRVQKALQGIPCDVLANLDNSDDRNAPTLPNLLEKLQNEKYTLLHIVCHGIVTKNKTDTMLYWANADSKLERVLGTTLIRELKERGYKLPHFTFLCACETASREEKGALGGLAGRLVRELGMPAVVAMTDRVEVNTAMTMTEQFYKHLVSSGEVDFALAKAVPVRHDTSDIIVPALFSRLGGLPLFSNSLEKELNDQDISRGLKRLLEVNQEPENEMPNDLEDESKNLTSDNSKSSEKKYVSLIEKHAPILREEYEEVRAELETILSSEKSLRKEDASLNRQKFLQKLNKLCKEVFSNQNSEFTFNALALNAPLPYYDALCPFQGLLSFDVKSKNFFFGRQKYIEDLKQKLKENNFVAVIGDSGSGKSSLVKAGLIPKLLSDDELNQMVCLTPGKNPQLKINSKSSILLVDQFEELFTFSNKIEGREFVNQLLKLLKQKRLRVVITMRVDFWGECANYGEEFRELIEKSKFFIQRMTSDELRDAMERQADKVGLRFEAGLSKLIWNEVEGEPGAMPLLQHALRELWKRRHGQWLLCDEYEKIGGKDVSGLKGAIAKTADDFYDGKHNGEKLSPEDKEQVKNIFMCLTQVDKNAVQGEPRRDTRRRVAKEEILKLNKENPNRILELVTLMADKRLVITSQNKETKQIEVEVAHEALIRYWPRLQKWLEKNRDDLMLRDKIREYAEDWEKHGKKDEFLNLGGEQLEKAEELSKNESISLGNLESEYIQACREWHDSQEREKLEKDLDVYTAYSDMHFEKNNRLDAIAKLIEVGEKLEKSPEITEYKKLHYLIMFGKLFNELAEFNSLNAHEGIVSSITFSREEDEIFASVGFKDGMIKFWTWDGTQIKIVEGQHSSYALKGEHSSIQDLAFSADGEMLVYASKDGSIKLWKTTVIKESEDNRYFISVKRIKMSEDYHKNDVCSVNFNDKYKRIASASKDKTVKLWSYEGNLVKSLLKHKGEVICVSFSPNGEMIASGDNNGNLRLWNSDGELLKEFKAHNNSVSTVSFSPDSKTLVSCSYDRYIKLWDTNTESIEQPIIKFIEMKEVVCTTFSPDGKKIASANQDGTLVLRYTNGKVIKTLKGHKGSVPKVMFSPDGSFLVSCGEDGNIKFWHCQSRFEGHDNQIWGIDFSADGKTIITASIDKTARLWKCNGDCLKIFPHDKKVREAKLSSDGRTAATITEDGVVRIWDDIKANENEALNKPICISESVVKSINFSPVDDIFITIGEDGIIKVFDLKGNLLDKKTPPKGKLTTLDFSTDGKVIVSADTDNSVIFWKFNDCKLSQTFEFMTDCKSNIYHVSFSNDNQKVAIVNQLDGLFTIQIFNLSGKIISSIKSDDENSIRDLKFSRDDTIIALVTFNSLEFWSFDGTLLKRVKLNERDINESKIYRASISPDWSAVAVAFPREDFENRIDLYNLNLSESVKIARQHISEYLKPSKINKSVI